MKKSITNFCCSVNRIMNSLQFWRNFLNTLQPSYVFTRENIGCLPFSKKQHNFPLKVKWNSNFPESPFWNCRLPPDWGSPLFLFGTEWQKFPYHLLNFSVSSLSSAENNYGKSNCKWQAPFLSVGLLISEKPLPVFNRHPHRFILTNGKHP